MALEASSRLEVSQGNDSDLPLAGMRVIDLLDGNAEMCGRLMADLGADVILIEPTEGLSSRQQKPVFENESLHFFTHQANKRSVILDLDREDDRENFLRLLSGAALLLDDGRLAACGISHEALRRKFPALIIFSITDFGLTGPWKDYRGTNAVIMALGGVLARSGIKGSDPLLPPGELAVEAAAVQAAWVGLLAYWQHLHVGEGNLLDFSLFEATAQIIDPGLGVTGSAAAGKSAAEIAHFGRPPVGKVYPIFPCRDGHVRICVLNPRQWQGMSNWLGGDHPFTDPSFNSLGKRFKAIKEINELIALLFKDQDADVLVSEGQKRGVPIASVSTPQQVLNNEHFNAREAFINVEVDGKSGKMPSGYFDIDGSRVGVRDPAPRLGQHTREVLAEAVPQLAETGNEPASRRPLDGIRVLDLGVIVAGAELGRLFADQGAELIKVESRSFPDGLRQSADGALITQSFAQGSRNKKSLGLNLRSDEGIALFGQLVENSDVVLSNFKPGTLESLGIGYQRLKALNPGIVLVESSALGNTGPLAKSMGYGPLVRASSGLTGLWCYPDMADSYSDSTTIFPDHFAGRLAATAVLAVLIKRRRTGKGAKIVLSQAEAILNTLATPLLRESLCPNTLRPQGNRYEFDAPANLFPCLGEDLWCMIEVRSTEDWLALCNVIGLSDLAGVPELLTSEGRLARREELEHCVLQWTSMHSPEEVMYRMQAAGLAAGKMLRINELLDNEQLRLRHFFREFNQPSLGRLITENGPVGHSDLPDPEIQPAPIQGQHTREIAELVLGLPVERIEQLIELGALEVATEEDRALAR
ncbi:CaiB/BaiF CoA transferase family protein [Zhongshania sp. BJYM1]|uniref:CaiB/BaiF CoA transferase family protein n=1 Tax=Zhongshania aquatica TaxID=2965069 RepID=UPI0022B58B34|nr:CoA transferase [Marortus sp. BJYM1]